ncbi:glutathione S-transferase [Paucibacter oligotrophus]|uniref:Glutathione S-transferase n=1 Tax=Roseateles oligotrophus TaxID=1769250 RepID=A0A840LD32_9BURK|nr:glutathione transferase GstA [Roseateles oligotrophus]MBB4846076.1 glutathione S-transferase [Roseateles oligotrophus]
MQTSFKLYYAPGACSLAPHILLRESGSSFTLEKVDTAKHLTADGRDFYAINSKGQVPVIELADGTRLSEGPVIAQYIADHADARALMPAAGSPARYRVMEWQNYIASEIHKSFTPLFHGDVDAVAKRALAVVLRKKLVWLDGQLAGKSFLTGETFTAADAYLFTVLRWAPYVQIDLTDLEHIGAFMARVSKRPAVQASMQAEGLSN